MYDPLDEAIVHARQRDHAKPATPKDNFRFHFLTAVAELCDKNEWFEDDVLAAKRYCKALLSPTTRELPDIDPEHQELINSKFAYGLARWSWKLDSNLFNGQRQDWFPALYAKKRRQLPKWHANRLFEDKPAEQPRLMLVA